jgi:hypothetical protein
VNAGTDQPTLDSLIAAEQEWQRVSEVAYHRMRRESVGSEAGARYAKLVAEADRKVADLRRQVRNHPDHTYDGL